MKRWMMAALLFAGLLLGGFYALGGQMGVLLLFARYGLHQEAGPSQSVPWAVVPTVAERGADKPNVVLIVADDLGYNDITLNGSGVAEGSLPTPNIDSIAANGVNFLRSYAGNATCSPSRAALLTGRYPTRFGFEFTSVPLTFSRVIAQFKSSSPLPTIYHAEQAAAMPPYESQGVPPSEVSLARLLKSQGYRTLHLGKWHLGEQPQFQPQAQGFDESLGFMAGGSMFLPSDDPGVVNAQQAFDPIDRFLWAVAPFHVQHNGGALFKPATYLTDYLTDEAIRAIDANRQHPFFLYLAYNAPHTPLQATRADYDALPQIKDHTRRVYAGMIRSLDRNIGRLLEHLRQQGQLNNTLVIFTSDNGGANYVGLEGLNSPFRGWKATFFEGGIRVPLLMQWPAQLKPGTTFAESVSHFDIFATVAAATGAPLPQDRRLDGVNLLPFAQGSRQGPVHEQLVWRSGGYQAIQRGDWKLQVNHTLNRQWLFNLREDAAERVNLIDRHPELAQALRLQLKAFNRQQAAPLWPAVLEVPVAIDKPMNRPYTSADEFIYWSN